MTVIFNIFVYALINLSSLIRKAYMELALTYLAHSGLIRLDSRNFLEPVSESGRSSGKRKLNKVFQFCILQVTVH